MLLKCNQAPSVVLAHLHNVGQPTDLSANRTADKRVIVVRLALIVENSIWADLMQRTAVFEVIAFHTLYKVRSVTKCQEFFSRISAHSGQVTSRRLVVIPVSVSTKAPQRATLTTCRVRPSPIIVSLRNR